MLNYQRGWVPPVPRRWGQGRAHPRSSQLPGISPLQGTIEGDTRTPQVCARTPAGVCRLFPHFVAQWFSEVFLQIIVPAVLFAPPAIRKLSAEAKTARNSLSWTILQGTSLLSRFYRATIPINSRKQGICLQNTGGGRGETTRLTDQQPCSQPRLAYGCDAPASFAASSSA